MNFSLFVEGRKWKIYWFLPSKFSFYHFSIFNKAEIDLASTKAQASAIWIQAVTAFRYSSFLYKFLLSVNCTCSLACQVCKSKTITSLLYQVFHSSVAAAAHFLTPFALPHLHDTASCATGTALEHTQQQNLGLSATWEASAVQSLGLCTEHLDHSLGFGYLDSA